MVAIRGGDGVGDGGRDGVTDGRNQWVHDSCDGFMCFVSECKNEK